MGSFLGHVAPGFVQMLFAFYFTFYVTQCVRRDSNKEKNEKTVGGPSHSRQENIVERVVFDKPVFLAICGAFALGHCIVETVQILRNPSKTSIGKHFHHVLMIFCYFSVSFCALLERKKYVPKTSSMIIVALGNWVEHALWTLHANMQRGTEALYHKFLVDLTLLGFCINLVTAWLWQTDSRNLHYMILASLHNLLLKGLYVTTTGIMLFDWSRPNSPQTRDDAQEPLLPYVLCIFLSLGIMWAVWGFVAVTEGRKTSDSHEFMALKAEDPDEKNEKTDLV